MKLVNLAVSSIIAIIMLSLVSHVAFANAPNENPTGRFVIFIADQESIAGIDGGYSLIESFIGLVSTLREGDKVMFLNLQQIDTPIGPALAGGPEFADFTEKILTSLRAYQSGQVADITSAIAQSYNLLGANMAEPGSTLYLLGGESSSNIEYKGSHISPIVGLFPKHRWEIVTISLPGESQDSIAFLKSISEGDSGNYFHLTVPDGYKALSDKLLKDSGKGALLASGQAELFADNVLTSSVDISPGTHEVMLLFFKEDPYGSMRLTNPDGFGVSAGDRSSSSTMETPNVVIWRLMDPVPGEWMVDVRGMRGAVSAWSMAVNKYRLVMETPETIPLNEEINLIAYVMDKDRMVVLDDGARVTTRITSPDGSFLVHELNDRGEAGDAESGDGYYSAALAPLGVVGEYGMHMELSWQNHTHKISSRKTFTVEMFPSIEMTSIQTSDLRVGERSLIATAYVNINGQPYGVPNKAPELMLTSHDSAEGQLEMIPRQLMDEGKAWMFDIHFTPTKKGLSSLMLKIELEYAGHLHTARSDTLMLESIPIPPVPSIIDRSETVPSQPTPAPSMAPVETRDESFPWGLLGIPVALVALLGAASIYWLSRTKPHGYICNEQNEVMADFSEIERSLPKRLLSRSIVSGNELDIPELAGTAFQFSGNHVELQSRRVSPTVRVNNQPLIGETRLKDRTWIGTHGKLFSFLQSKPQPAAETGGVVV